VDKHKNIKLKKCKFLQKVYYTFYLDNATKEKCPVHGTSRSQIKTDGYFWV
jgi:hypothetical protein